MTATAPARLEFEAETHTYRVDGSVIPSVTQVLESAGISDFSGVPNTVLARAADRGTAVHRACWFDDQDDLDLTSVDPEISGYVDAWRRFRAERNIRILEIESQFFHPQFRFAGTFDRLIEMPKWGRVILDLKTGELAASWRIQLAAYVRGFFDTMAPNCRRAAIKLNGNGTYALHWYEMRDMVRDWNVFASALEVHNYRRENGLL